MRVIYGLLYYYLLAVVAACILLVIFVPRFIRRPFFNLIEKLRLSTATKFLFYGIIMINFIVLADSVNTYYQYRELLTTRNLCVLCRENWCACWRQGWLSQSVQAVQRVLYGREELHAYGDDVVRNLRPLQVHGHVRQAQWNWKRSWDLR